MDSKEFKAWFEGFCDSIDGAPTAAQFDKIKAKVQTLTGEKIDFGKLFPREPTPRWEIR